MALFDMLNQVAKNISDKTSDAIEATKAGTKVLTERSAAGEVLKKIGEYYYARFTEGAVLDAEVMELCQTAKTHYDAVEQAQKEIDQLKAESEPARAPAPSGPVCPACGAMNSAGTKFCQSCGARLEATAPVERKCPGCSAVVAPGVRFCPECGYKMEE